MSTDDPTAARASRSPNRLATTQSAEAQPQSQSQATAVQGGTGDDHLAIEQLIYRHAIALDSLDRAAYDACYAVGALKPDVDWVMEYHREYAHTMHNVLNH